MAMLAQPRASKKYVLQPRGKPLYEDETRFGSKMLEKMGWTKGKGLGRKENGEINIIEVDYKNDSSGFGFEDRNDQWTQHDASFNELLQRLNENTDPKISKAKESASITEKFSRESLEKKSKSSKARVHYQKFTKGKDISQYSEKDLANIFGMKSFENVYNGCQVESNKKEVRREPEPALKIKEKSFEPQEEISEESVRKAKKRKRKNISEQSDFLEKPDQQTSMNKEKSIKNHAQENVKRKKSSEEIEEDNIGESEITVPSPQKVITVDSNSFQVPEKEAIEISNRKNKRKKHPKDEHNTHGTDVEKQDEITLTTGLVKQPTTIDNKSRLAVELAIEQDAFEENWKTVKRKIKSTKTSCETSIQSENKETREEEIDNPLSSEESNEKYIISSFCAEKFRNVALDQFNGSNLVDIIGYGLNENMKLEIQYKKSDQYHIINLWGSVLDKYNDAEPKNRHSAFVEKAKETFQNHKSSQKKTAKLAKHRTKKCKKKQIFQRL